ncbi:MAG: DUF2752 domain-containing protein [Bacteroidia bacterium]
MAAQTDKETAGVCLIKHTTNIPCPSCGSTRSVIFLSRGDFQEAFNMNPFGYVVALIMVLLPLWILFDILAKKETLLKSYRKMEVRLKKPAYAIPLVTLVLMNWIWNITKGL